MPLVSTKTLRHLALPICLISLLFSRPAYSKIVTGKLFYEIDNTPIKGAKVYSNFSQDSTITDRNGWFKIRIDSANSEQLTFYAKDCDFKSIILNNRHHVEVKLKLATIPLKEMVVSAHLIYRTMEILAPEGWRRIPDSHTHAKITKYTKYGYPGLDWQKEVLENIRYPRILIEVGMEGYVYAEFSVSPSGEITNATIKKGLGKELNKEVLNAILSARNFTKEEVGTYGTVQGKVYPRTYKISVKFELTFDRRYLE